MPATNQRHSGQQGYRRPAIFQSIEVYERIDGEWVRSDKESSPPITLMIIAWADKQGVDITFVSPPSFRYLSVEETRRVSWTGVSILYRPTEVIDDGTGTDEEANQAPEIQENLQAILQQISQGEMPVGIDLGGSPPVGSDSSDGPLPPGSQVFEFPTTKGAVRRTPGQ